MIERNATILVLSAALLIPGGIGAQVASKLDAGSLVTSSGDGSLVPASVFQVAPNVLMTRPNAALSAGASAWLLGGQQWQLVDGAVSGTLISPTVYGVRVELLGNASRTFDDQSLGTDQVDVETRVNVPLRDNGGVWIGGGVARPWKISAVSLADLMNGGAWTKIGGATITSTLTNVHFTKAAREDSITGVAACAASPAGDLGLVTGSNFSTDGSPTSCTHQSSISDLETSVHWDLNRIELNGAIGYRFGDDLDVSSDSRRWGTGSATLWVSPRLAIVAGGGRQPANIERGLPSRTYGSLGMEVAYSPASRNTPVTLPRITAVRAFDIRGVQEGMQRITIRVGGVERVDVIGDFSDWQPLTLTRRGRDLWELVVPLNAGVYQINLRVDDGPWFAPPGLPMIRDGFGGQAGMLLVPK